MRQGLAAAAVALVIYVLTLAPGLTEIDAGELAGVAATLGVAHPSGYPLFSIVGRGWTLLPWPLRTITAMNFFSAVLAAGAVFLVHRTIRDLLPPGRPREIGAWTGSLAFGLNGTMWSVATVTEVHALQMFLDAAFLHAIVRAGLWGGRPFKESAFLAACYLGGLCLTNHLTSALLLPGFGLALWLRRRHVTPRILAAGAGAGLLGLSVYAFLPIRAAQFPVFSSCRRSFSTMRGAFLCRCMLMKLKRSRSSSMISWDESVEPSSTSTISIDPR